MKAINQTHRMSRLCRRKYLAAILMSCGFLICLTGPLPACTPIITCIFDWECTEGQECCGGTCIEECTSCEECDEASGTCDYSLPDGCSDCGMMEPYISLDADITHFDNSPLCTEIGDPPCGAAFPNGDPTITVSMPCHTDCAWEFGVEATVDYYWGSCEFTELMDVNAGEIAAGVLTEDNYCDIVEGFYYDDENGGEAVDPDAEPPTPGTGSGCVSIGDTLYSVYDCISVHEEEHKKLYVQGLATQENLLASNSAFEALSISETDPETCQDAKTLREADIEDAVGDAYIDVCVDCHEDAAHDAAQSCFEAVAALICETVATEHPNWASCAECDEIP